MSTLSFRYAELTRDGEEPKTILVNLSLVTSIDVDPVTNLVRIWFEAGNSITVLDPFHAIIEKVQHAQHGLNVV